MARSNPLRRVHQEAEASLISYGPSEGEHPPVELVETFGELDLEYAAIRKACVLIDQPNRGVIELTGPDRVDFLNRMLTQELKGMQAGEVRASFWLNRKGRVDADLRVIHMEERTLLEMDVHAVARTIAGLSAYIITEDVVAKDITEVTHRLALHGPTAELLLGTAPGAGRCASVRVRGRDVLAFGSEDTGETSVELVVPVEAALEVYEHLVETGSDPNQGMPEALTDPATRTLGSQVRLRQAGWHAYNIARIEAGVPLYYVDFGPNSLPAETGVLMERVSFTKGCYLGQEIVARMRARGHPKQELVALKLARQIDLVNGTPRQPITGAAVLKKEATESLPGEPVGAVTSSTTSPMLGAAAICFAQVKHELATAGTEVMVVADDTLVAGVVQPTLRFWGRE